MTDQLSAQPTGSTGASRRWPDSGFTALKAEPLAKAMGVSRGSFYWHFADVGAFHAAILRHWRDVAAEQVIADLEAASDSDNGLAAAAAPRVRRRGFRWRRRFEPGPRSTRRRPLPCRAIDRRRLSYVESCCLRPEFRRGWPRARAQILYWAFSDLRCRTSRCHRQNRRRCSTNCSRSPRGDATGYRRVFFARTRPNSPENAIRDRGRAGDTLHDLPARTP